MALNENIPYIYDSKSSANGILWGSSLKHIITLGGRQTVEPYTGISILNDCCFIKAGVMSPFVTQCLAKENTQPIVSINSVFKPYNTNLGYFLCDNGGSNVEQNNNLEYYNNARSLDIASGAIRNYPVSYNYLPANIRVAVGNFDLSHYFIVPQITACIAGSPNSVIRTDLKTYKNQYAASHPHIVYCSYNIYYKGDLNTTQTGALTRIKLWGTIQNNDFLNWQRNSSSGNKVNVFATKFASQRLLPVNVIYAPPNTRYFKVQIPLTVPAVYLPSVVSDIGLTSTHGPDVSKLAFDSTNPAEATLVYAYTDYNTIISILDSMGMWYVESGADIANAHGSLTTSEFVHAPVIDDNGIPTGSITGGGVTDPENSPIYQNWNDQNNTYPIGGGDALGAKEIDPQAPIKPNTDQTQTPVSFDDIDDDLAPATPQLNGLGSFSNYYALAKTGIDSLNDFLWNSDESTIDDILNSLKLFGQNPISAIISLRLYPFALTSIMQSLTAENIVLGRVDTGVSGLKITSNASTSINLGSIYLAGKYNNFLDYAPYSSYNLYIPFCGNVSLNPNICLNRFITVKMIVDITTGKCTAIIYVGDSAESGVPIQYVDGMIGVEIPVTAENMGKLASATIEAVGNTAVSGLTQGVIGGAFAAIGGALDVMFTDVSNTKTGNVSAAGALSMPIKCYIIASTPTIQKPYNFSHTYGNIANDSGILSMYSGFTICENVDTTSIQNATIEEQEEIKNLLENGVYL